MGLTKNRSHKKKTTQKSEFELAFDKGNKAFDNDKFQTALTQFDKCCRLDPQHAEALIMRGLCLSELERHEDAISSFDNAISIDPDSAEAHYNKGVSLGELHKPRDALSCFERAVKLDNSQGVHFAGLARALLDLGDVEVNVTICI
jgi:tetratricopeptide (TPR) repeat protein